MLYLENTTSARAAFIPKNTDAYSDAETYGLTLTSTVELSTPLDVTVIDLHISQLYYDVAFSLPEGIAEGEYKYELTAGNVVLASGLAVVGGPEASGEEYEISTIYEQYESE